MSETLTLVLTRRCNLRCGWCPQEFQDRDMDLATARAAVRGAARRLGPSPSIKLFGGEPLLAAGLIRETVAFCASEGLTPRFELPTNGLLLDARWRAYLERHPEIEVFLSRPFPDASRLPSVARHLLLPPGANASSVLATVASDVANGVRRFNVLPAYFTRWSEEQLSGLRSAFAALAALLPRLAAAGRTVELLNIGRRGPVPLYNAGWTVDADGQVYASNLALVRASADARASLRLGRAEDWGGLRPPPTPEVLEEALGGCFGAEELASTRRVDALLTGFVGRMAARA